jgi:hypothetical protein
VEPKAKPYLLKPGENLPDWGNGVKASVDSTDGGFTLIESSTSGGAPWHVHTREDEAFYVLEPRNPAAGFMNRFRDVTRGLTKLRTAV